MPASLLEAFVKVAPYLPLLFAQDTAISVVDREKVLVYVPGKKLNHGVKPGDALLPSSLVGRAISEGTRKVGRVGKELLGVPYVGRAIPIVEDGEVVGGIVVTESVETEDFLLALAARLSENVQEVTAAGEQLVAAAQQLAVGADALNSLAEEAAVEAGRGEQILAFIKDIAVKTNLLGINAAIQAAHIGHLGAGFNVVAREIRALADKTAKHVREVGELTGSIIRIIHNIREHSKRILQQVQEQSDASQSMAQSLVDISKLAEELVSLTERLRGGAKKNEAPEGATTRCRT
ncbi:MAG: methyl-accepting chemotaxis protein [Desulfotomaculales bacterium]